MRVGAANKSGSLRLTLPTEWNKINSIQEGDMLTLIGNKLLIVMPKRKMTLQELSDEINTMKILIEMEIKGSL
jgi:antitoxin component of MazEF toxin-antitoxin module